MAVCASLTRSVLESPSTTSAALPSLESSIGKPVVWPSVCGVTVRPAGIAVIQTDPGGRESQSQTIGRVDWRYPGYRERVCESREK